MVTIKTTEEIRWDDFTGVLSIEDFASYKDYEHFCTKNDTKYIKTSEVIK